MGKSRFQSLQVIEANQVWTFSNHVADFLIAGFYYRKKSLKTGEMQVAQ